MANSSTAVALRPSSHRCIETIHRRVNAARPGGERRTPADVVEAPRRGPVAYIDAVPGRRSVVDYSLQRRAVLAEVYSGRKGVVEVCDASPFLSRVGVFHGTTDDEACPVVR